MANTITTNGKNIYINRCFESSPTYTKIQYYQLGMCAKTPAVTDTKLYSPLPISTASVASIDDCDATAGWSNGGDATAVALNNTAGEFMEGTGCLNMPTTYSAGTSNWYRTVGAFDGTTDYFAWPVYITDLADITAGASACVIHLGTGGFTDYNIYNFNKTQLQVGWNALVCDVDNPDSTAGAGATENAIDRIKLTITNATTWTTNDVRMDWVQTYPIADTFGSWVSGYPTYNTTNKSVSISGQDLSTQTNGYYLREFGLFNGDATKLLYSRGTYTSILKSQYVSVTYNQTDSFT